MLPLGRLPPTSSSIWRYESSLCAHCMTWKVFHLCMTSAPSIDSYICIRMSASPPRPFNLQRNQQGFTNTCLSRTPILLTWFCARIPHTHDSRPTKGMGKGAHTTPHPVHCMSFCMRRTMPSCTWTGACYFCRQAPPCVHSACTQRFLGDGSLAAVRPARCPSSCSCQLCCRYPYTRTLSNVPG